MRRGATDVVGAARVRVRLAVGTRTRSSPRAASRCRDAVFDRLGARGGQRGRAAPRDAAGQPRRLGARWPTSRSLPRGYGRRRARHRRWAVRRGRDRRASWWPPPSSSRWWRLQRSPTLARAELAPIAWDRRTSSSTSTPSAACPATRSRMIVVPIVAAHGMAIPKTSSRAITSAAGTADIMECARGWICRPRTCSRVVDDGGGRHRLGRTHLPQPARRRDERHQPPARRARRPALDVSSILSKKLAVGATHVAIDIPVGPAAKVKTAAEGEALARLFEDVGRAVGLTVRAVVSDGALPIGRGVGPALELCGRAGGALTARRTPRRALRAKALELRGHDLGVGRGRARRARASPEPRSAAWSGAALDAFRAIVAAQGRSRGASAGRLHAHALGRALRHASPHRRVRRGGARARRRRPARQGRRRASRCARRATRSPRARSLADVVASSQNGIDAIRDQPRSRRSLRYRLTTAGRAASAREGDDQERDDEVDDHQRDGDLHRHAECDAQDEEVVAQRDASARPAWRGSPAGRP